MHKSTYLGHCQLRHPHLQRDLLVFHQQFPALFKRGRKRPFKYLGAPPRWLQDVFEFTEIPPSYLKVVPQTFNALPYLHSMEIALCADRFGYPQWISPESGKRFAA